MDEKIRIERKDRWWNFKLNLCIELSEMTTTLFSLIAGRKDFDASVLFQNIPPRIGVLYDNPIISAYALMTLDLINKLKPEDDRLETSGVIGKSLADIVKSMKTELNIE